MNAIVKVGLFLLNALVLVAAAALAIALLVSGNTIWALIWIAICCLVTAVTLSIK